MSGALIAASTTAALGRVVLNSANYTASDSNTIGIGLLRNGGARTYRTASGDLVYNWYVPNAPNIGDFYECAVLISFGSFTSGVPAGTWVPIDGTLSIWGRTTPGSVTGQLSVRIASTDDIIAQVAFNLTRT